MVCFAIQEGSGDTHSHGQKDVFDMRYFWVLMELRSYL